MSYWFFSFHLIKNDEGLVLGKRDTFGNGVTETEEDFFSIETTEEKIVKDQPGCSVTILYFKNIPSKTYHGYCNAHQKK